MDNDQIILEKFIDILKNGKNMDKHRTHIVWYNDENEALFRYFPAEKFLEICNPVISEFWYFSEIEINKLFKLKIKNIFNLDLDLKVKY